MARVRLSEEDKAQNRRELRRVSSTPIDDEPQGPARADLMNQRQDWLNKQNPEQRAKGGAIKSKSSASRRADGIAQRGKTKGRVI